MNCEQLGKIYKQRQYLTKQLMFRIKLFFQMKIQQCVYKHQTFQRIDQFNLPGGFNQVVSGKLESNRHEAASKLSKTTHVILKGVGHQVAKVTLLPPATVVRQIYVGLSHFVFQPLRQIGFPIFRQSQHISICR